MALAKITLKLGKKKIELTQEEFEELKQDMRELDKNHHYYWHNYSPYWYTTISSGPRLSYQNVSDCVSTSAIDAALPDFKGTIVSYSAQ